MRRPWTTSSLLAGLAVAACATVPPVPDAKVVDRLELEGTTRLDDAAVKARIVTTESSCWPAWVPGLGRAPRCLWGHVEWFDATAWQADLRRITRYYEARGYYQARILDEKLEEKEPGQVRLLVRLREGEPARLREVTVKGLEALPEAHRAAALESFPLKEGAIFLEDDWQRAKGQLVAELRQLGYAEAQVAGHATVDADEAGVAARLEVQPGRRYTFGRVLVATDPGATVPPKLIVEQTASDLKAGDYFSESALANAQARVFQMGVFAAVKVNRGATEEGTVPVVISVREAPFRSVRFGVGAGGDQIRQDVHVAFEHTHRNIGFARFFDKDARLDRLTVKVKAGLAFLPTFPAVLLNAPSSQLGPVGAALTEYELPRAFGRRDLSLQTSLNVSRALEAAYDYYGGEAKVGLVWRPRGDVTVVPSLNFNVYALTSELSPGTTAPTAAIGCPKWPTLCVISFLGLTGEWDRRDDRLEPRHGFYAALDVQLGVSQAAQLAPYLRVAPELRGYASFGPHDRFTAAGKLRAGTLLAPENQAPIIARFFSGGSSMRGFNQRRLSPQVAVQVLDAQKELQPVGDPAAGDPVLYRAQALSIGGSGLFEASLELRWNLSEGVSLAVFDDTALVTWEPLLASPLGLAALSTAVGLGVRFHTPIGPLRVDVAARLPMVGGPQTPRQPETPVVGPLGPGQLSVPVNGGCFFNAGYDGNPAYAGSPDNLCAWHLSIGEAF